MAPETTTEHREPGSAIQAERLQEYLRLDHFLKNIAEGRTLNPCSMRRLSVRPLIKDSAWVPEDGPTPVSSIHQPPAPRDEVSYPNLRDRLCDVIFHTSSLVTFRWDSNFVAFPDALGKALVLGAPQLLCLSIKAPGSGHELDFLPLKKLQQVSIILETGVRFSAQIRSMKSLLLLPNIAELQIPSAVLDTALQTHAFQFQPTLQHVCIKLTPYTAPLHIDALQNIHSLHLQGSGDALLAFWARLPAVPVMRFFTLQYDQWPHTPTEIVVDAQIIIALAACAPVIERLKITDQRGTPQLGCFVFHDLQLFTNLRVLAVAVKSMACDYVEDLVESLPGTVSMVSICVGDMSAAPEDYFQLFLTLREQLRMLRIHCVTRAKNARDQKGSTATRRADSARAAAEKVLLDFTKLDAIGTEGYIFEVPRVHGARVPGPLPLLPLRWRESVFDTTDAEWALDSGLDGE
ncbi:hypothetical protein HWV62_26580 [Athelia sp. TMB]|nr:hypothetical protein HWV62_26580 [Athelia sp. TMB]